MLTPYQRAVQEIVSIIREKAERGLNRDIALMETLELFCEEVTMGVPAKIKKVAKEEIDPKEINYFIHKNEVIEEKSGGEINIIKIKKKPAGKIHTFFQK